MVYFYLLLSLTIGFVVSLLIIPIINKVSIDKKLFDVPDHRSAAKHAIPTLGGIAIFAGFVISQIISLNNFDINDLKYMYLGVLVMFILGLKDDLIALSARTKLIVQIVVAFYLVIFGNIRITDFHGILGIQEVNYISGVIFSVITIVGIINAMNLIDGIDGLASGVGLLISLVYGIWFFYIGDYIYALTGFSLFGSLFAFFIYNVFGTTNKIFMGDTGSLILGTIIALLTINFNESDFSIHTVQGLPAISLAIIIVPIIDSIRIFIIRLSQGKSPFSPDMNHIHHQVLRLTDSHIKASLIIIAANSMFIILSFNLIDTFGNNILFFLLLVLGFFIAEIPSFLLYIQNKNVQPLEHKLYSEGRFVLSKTDNSFILASTPNEIVGNKITNVTYKNREHQFKLITESIPVGIFTTDTLGAINYVNPRWCEISQINFEEAIGDGWLKSVHPDDREALALSWQEATSANCSLTKEYRSIRPDGSIVFIIVHAVPLKDKKDNTVGYTGTIIDITKRKNMENDLLSIKAKAEKSEQLKSAFLNNINHEIRTPMNSIMGFSGLLKNLDLTTKKGKVYLTIIEKSSAQLLQIVNDILDISIIESDQLNVSISVVNIKERFQFIYELLKDELKEKGLLLSVSIPPNLPKKLITDRDKLDAILIKLVRNAVKNTKKGSIEFGYRMNSNNGEIEFFVKDTGVGISIDRQKDIFEPFIQTANINKNSQNGLGLGLSISKAYVEKLGGKIWIQSEENKGSTFYFTLPNYIE